MPSILVIDDKQDNLISVRALLQNLIPDCRVFTAQSGKEGLAIAEKEQPDTILLDIIMPEMDGYQVCEELKKKKTTEHIPVIMLTAIKTDTESRIKGLEAGADAFFSKPIDPAELSAQINVMLRIKNAEDQLRQEKERLEKTVWERTRNFIKSENKYRSMIEEVLDTSVVGVILLDADFKIVWVNHSLGEYFGLQREKIIGQDIRSLVRLRMKSFFEHPKEFEDRVLATYDDNSYEEHFECHVLPRGGRKERWLEHWSRPISKGLYRGGRIEHYSDITERKKTVEELLREKQFSENILETANVFILTLDLKGNITLFNRFAENLTGYKKEEVLHKNWFDLFIPARNSSMIPSVFASVLKKLPEVTAYENPIVCKDGSERLISWSNSILKDKNGAVSGVLSIGLDVTDSRAADERIKKSSAELAEQLAKSEKQRIASVILYKDLNEA